MKEYLSHLLLNNDSSGFGIITNEYSLNSLEIKSKVNQFCRNFKGPGIKNDSLIGILINDPEQFIICLIALWRIGAVPVPLNVKLTNDELKYIISDGDISLIITDSKINFDLPGISIYDSNTGFSKKYASNLTGSEEFEYPELSRRALIIYTSGSSGRAKGVIHTFSSLISAAQSGNNFLQQNKSDRWLASLPFYHIGGISIIIRSLIFESTLILPVSLKHNDIKEALIKKEPSLASFVSIQMLRMIRDNVTPPDSLRNVLFGGGFIDESIISRALAAGWKVSRVYGASETAAFVTAIDSEELKSKPQSSGKQILPNEVYIVDSSGNILPDGHTGEIAIKSPSLFSEYLNDKAETKKKLNGNFYFSGDIGYKDQDGFLYVEARRTDLIITGGENVNPFEVESAILTYPDVSEVIVFGIQDKEWGQVVAAAIILKPDSNINDQMIREFLKEKLSSYKIPKKIFFTDKLPKNDMGKINKQQLTDLFQKG